MASAFGTVTLVVWVLTVISAVALPWPKGWLPFRLQQRRHVDDRGKRSTMTLLNPDDAFSPTAHDVYHTTFILRQLTISDLIPQILDLAEYWVQTKVATTVQKIVSQRNAGQLYLAAPVLQFGTQNSVRKLVFTVTSRDQGWSGDRQHQGTYEQSYTWFEAMVFEPDAYELAKVVVPGRRIITNVHAGRAEKMHVVEWSRRSDDAEQRKILRELKSGQRIGITAWARFPGWTNHVSGASIRIYQSAVTRG